jgi:hypothetical protein
VTSQGGYSGTADEDDDHLLGKLASPETFLGKWVRLDREDYTSKAAAPASEAAASEAAAPASEAAAPASEAAPASKNYAHVAAAIGIGLCDTHETGRMCKGAPGCVQGAGWIEPAKSPKTLVSICRAIRARDWDGGEIRFTGAEHAKGRLRVTLWKNGDSDGTAPPEVCGWSLAKL